MALAVTGGAPASAGGWRQSGWDIAGDAAEAIGAVLVRRSELFVVAGVLLVFGVGDRLFGMRLFHRPSCRFKRFTNSVIHLTTMARVKCLAPLTFPLPVTSILRFRRTRPTPLGSAVAYRFSMTNLE
jgi:hypothetical protein